MSHPLISRALVTAAITDAGVMLFFQSSIRPGYWNVPADVWRTPGPCIACASANAVVVFPLAPVISIIGCGISVTQQQAYRFVVGDHP